MRKFQTRIFSTIAHNFFDTTNLQIEFYCYQNVQAWLSLITTYYVFILKFRPFPATLMEPVRPHMSENSVGKIISLGDPSVNRYLLKVKINKIKMNILLQNYRGR